MTMIRTNIEMRMKDLLSVLLFHSSGVFVLPTAPIFAAGISIPWGCIMKTY